MSQRGRSARTRPQRLARRRASSQGFDRGGARRSRLFSRPVIATVGAIMAIALIASLAAVAFDSGGGQSPTTDPPPSRRSASQVDIGAVEGKPIWNAPPAFALVEGVDYGAEIELEDGAVVVIDLLEGVAPEHVNNFVFLVNEDFYDGLTFHRVVPGFIVQAGDPTATGTGGAGYTMIDEPIHDGNEDALSVTPIGVVSMARSGAGASSSQFFIKLGDQAHLDEQGFTSFGTVTSGLALLYAFDTRDPSALPTPPAGPLIVEIRITEQQVTE